jgi:repressor of nif and glnA expression
MSEKTEKKELAILRLLQKAGGPVSSLRLKENLHAMGHEVSERTIRHYFLELDRRGLTENRGKKGRVITEQGLKELGSARVYDKVGLLAAKIDQLTYRMSFDLYKKSGTVIINVSIAKLEQLPEIVPLVTRVYAAGYSMGTMMAIFEPGERVGGGRFHNTGWHGWPGNSVLNNPERSPAGPWHSYPLQFRWVAGVAGPQAHAFCGDHQV